MPMNKHLLFFSFFIFNFSLFTCVAQNLVPNFSFEQYDTCPNSGDQIQYATGWSKYSFWTTTPDYYNACAPAGYFSVPDNGASYQLAHRNCGAYAAVVTFFSLAINYREHIGIQLSHPLTIGQKYFISFYTVMGGEKKVVNNYFEMPSNNIGIRLSTVAYNGNNPCPIDNFAHINYPMILNDSINWNRISGSIIADSAYNYLIVGNFFDDANTDTLNYNCDSCLNQYSYYLVDDICLSTDSLLCNGGIDELPCNAGINEIALDREVNIFPNPSMDEITINIKENFKNCNIIFYDLLGKKYHEFTILPDANKININDFCPGIYFIQLNINNKIFYKKIIINH
jgi:hypothetical protein